MRYRHGGSASWEFPVVILLLWPGLAAAQGSVPAVDLKATPEALVFSLDAEPPTAATLKVSVAGGGGEGALPRLSSFPRWR
jgi:hypothetical protein